MQNLMAALSRLPTTPRLPAIFIGHGSPMNAIEDNTYSRSWRELGESLPAPIAILCVSAHWTTRGLTKVNVKEWPQTIHDFGGFPAELYAQKYPAPGAPLVARAVINVVRSTRVEPDVEWGLDHGAWSVLMQMFPADDIPVFELSLDLMKTPLAHFQLAKELKCLREKGVLIIGSGNIVHNLGMLTQNAQPYDWAVTFDEYVADALERRDFMAIVESGSLGPVAQLAHPTPEHFLPILYALGAAGESEIPRSFNAFFELASISMRSFVLSRPEDG